MEHVLGRYELIEELGRGAMGVVYKARDPVLNRIVAIKTMSAEAADDEELRSRLTREANAAAKLKHPNIITIHDYGEHQGVPYIALEFLEGIDLKQIIRNRIPLFPLEKLGILKQVALGLGHAHKMGVIHRDVKPGNIRILRDGTVKIMDFGIARIASSQMTRVGTVLGSVDYMSPEQVEGQQVDHRCDQFGFAVVAYEVLAHKLPFKGDSMPATMNNILQKKPRPLPENVYAPFPGLEDLIAKCLQKVPTERYESFQEIARALERIEALIVPDDATPLDMRAVTPDDLASGDEEETIVIAESENAAVPEGDNWQSGERTVSSAHLWAARDRFQKISASLEKLEADKPKRPVHLGSASRTPAPRTSATGRAPSVRTPPPWTSRGRLVTIAMAAAVVIAAGVSWLVLRPDNGGNTSSAQVEEFAAARLEASSGLVDAGDYRGALEQLQRILEVQPDHPEAQRLHAEVQARLDAEFDASLEQARELAAAGDLESASQSLAIALALKPDDPEAARLRNETNSKLDEQQTAAVAQERLASLVATAREQLSSGQADDAVTTLRAASAIDPNDGDVQQLLERAQQAVGQRGRAEQAYRAGVAALEQNDLSEAIAQLETAVQLDPSHRPARARLEEARREQARPRFGTLTINALPFGEAFLNGDSLGTTPVRLEEVSAGSYTVRVVKDGYREFNRTIVVEEGQTTNIVAQLERNP